ncbi:MAG: DUF2178 domain-containing protein [Candidatus Bathyarchaeia archaeon]|jgi:uncharacterized membrane protein
MKRETTYKIWRMIVTLFISAGFSFGIIQEQFIVSLAFLAAGLAILQVLRTKYKSVVLSDERTKLIGEKASQNTILCFIVGSSILICVQLVLTSFGIEIQELQAFTQPLSYLILAFMLVYSIFSFYYSRKM